MAWIKNHRQYIDDGFPIQSGEETPQGDWVEHDAEYADEEG